MTTYYYIVIVTHCSKICMKFTRLNVGCCTGAQALLGAVFGPGIDPIFFDEVACTGLESHLANCSHPGIGIADCGHSEDAGVSCSGKHAICDNGIELMYIYEHL